MRILTFFLSMLLICLTSTVSPAAEFRQTPKGCVAYFLKIVPGGGSGGRNILHTNNVYFEIFDVTADRVLDRNKVDHDGSLFFRFCLPGAPPEMTLRYRFDDPQGKATELAVDLTIERMRRSSPQDPDVIIFEPDELLGRKGSDQGPQAKETTLAVPVRFADCSGSLLKNPRGMMVVSDASGRVIRKADARSNIIPLDLDMTSLLSFMPKGKGKAYRIRPQSVTPLLLKGFLREPFEIVITQVPEKTVSLKFEGLLPRAAPRLVIKDSQGFGQAFMVDPGKAQTQISLGLPCDGSPAHYTLTIVEDGNYQGGNYDFDLSANSPAGFTVGLVQLSAGPARYYFLINIAGRQMQESLDSVKESLKAGELKKLTGNHMHFFMAFEGTVRETDLRELYFDPSVRENVPKLLKNFVSGLPQRTRKHLIYVTSSGRTIRYRTDLPEQAMTDKLSKNYNMTFSAVVIGDAESGELKKMAGLGDGVYRTVPIPRQREIEKAFREVITGLN